MATAGPATAFRLNAFSFVFVAVVFWWWKQAPAAATLPAERFVAALRTGMRYVRHHPRLRAVLVRNVALMTGASGLRALIPIAVRGEMRLSAAGYGLLLRCLGVGAIAAIGLMPCVAGRMPIDARVTGATVLFAGATAGLSGLP